MQELLFALHILWFLVANLLCKWFAVSVECRYNGVAFVCFAHSMVSCW